MGRRIQCSLFRARMTLVNGDVGEWSSPTQQWTTAQECTGEEYLKTVSEKLDDFKCTPCPEGADCAGPVSSQTLRARPGFWRGSLDSEIFEECIYASDCPGNVTLQRANSSINSQCRKGHSGTLCAICLPNHVRDAAQNNSCILFTGGGWTARS